jgi:hypothetical protein
MPLASCPTKITTHPSIHQHPSLLSAAASYNQHQQQLDIIIIIIINLEDMKKSRTKKHVRDFVCERISR